MKVKFEPIGEKRFATFERSKDRQNGVISFHSFRVSIQGNQKYRAYLLEIQINYCTILQCFVTNN